MDGREGTVLSLFVCLSVWRVCLSFCVENGIGNGSREQMLCPINPLMHLVSLIIHSFVTWSHPLRGDKCGEICTCLRFAIPFHCLSYVHVTLQRQKNSDTEISRGQHECPS